MLQATGDVFSFLNEKESNDLHTLIATVWSNDIWSVDVLGQGLNAQHIPMFNYEKVKKLKEMTVNLITQLSHKDPG